MTTVPGAISGTRTFSTQAAMRRNEHNTLGPGRHGWKAMSDPAFALPPCLGSAARGSGQRLFVRMSQLAKEFADRVRMTWDRIDLRKDAAGPRKGRAVVPINNGLWGAHQEAQQAALSDHVIEWAGGSVKSIKKGFASAATRAGLQGVTPHVLRYTCAVHMAEGGVPMAEISQYLGHSSTDITARVYARDSSQHLLKAAKIVNFTRPGVAV